MRTKTTGGETKMTDATRDFAYDTDVFMDLEREAWYRYLPIEFGEKAEVIRSAIINSHELGRDTSLFVYSRLGALLDGLVSAVGTVCCSARTLRELYKHRHDVAPRLVMEYEEDRLAWELRMQRFTSQRADAVCWLREVSRRPIFLHVDNPAPWLERLDAIYLDEPWHSGDSWLPTRRVVSEWLGIDLSDRRGLLLIYSRL